MNRLTRLALERPSITLLITFFLLAGGVFAAGDLNQELVPQVEFPQATVVTLWPGASADEITNSVVEPIESALEGITDVQVVEVSSSASESFAATTLRAEYGTTQDELRDAIEAELKDVVLPEDAEDPQVVLFSFSDLPVVQASVRGADGDLDTAELQRIVKDQVLEELEGIEGVSSVALAGGREEKVFIDIDPVRLNARNQSLGAIKGALQANDLSFPAGSLEVDGKTIPLQVVHRLSSETDLANLALGGGQGGPPGGAPGGQAPGAGDPEASSPTPAADRPSTGARVRTATATPERTSSRQSRTLLAIRLPAEVVALGYATTRDLTPDAVRTLQAARPDLLQQIADDVIRQVPPGGPSPVTEAVLDALPADIRRRLRERLDAPADDGSSDDAEPTAESASPDAGDAPARAAADAGPASDRSAATETAAASSATASGQAAGGLAGLIAEQDPASIEPLVRAAPELLAQLDPAMLDQLLRAAPELLGELDPQVVSDILGANPDLARALDPATIESVLQSAPQLLSRLDPAVINDLLSAAPELVSQLDPTLVDELLRGSPELLGALDPDLIAGLVAAAPEALARLDQEAVVALLGNLDPAAVDGALRAAPDLLDRLDPAAIEEIPEPVLRRIPASVLSALPSSLRTAVLRRLSDTRAPIAGGRRLLQAEDGTVRVGDVAEVSRELEPAETFNRTDGDPSLSLILYKDQSANTVSVVDAVLARLTELEESGDLDEDLKFNVVFEQGTFIKDSLKGVRNEGILGGLFAVLVILIFLNFSVRSTLVTAISIPISIVVALLLMRMQGLTLNILSLAGLTIAIGRVVDDAIVVIENIYRHIQAGEPVRDAVIRGTREVSTAITAATLVTVAVFLPLGLVGGITSEFFKPFAFTASYALLASLLVALTVVPLVAGRLMRRDNLPEDHEGLLLRLYTPTLRWALEHRFLTLLMALIFFVGSLSLVALVDKTFLPSFGEAAIQVEMALPPGTDLATTDAVSQDVEDLLMDWDGIDTVETTVGRGSQFFGQFSGGDSARAYFFASIDKAEAGGATSADEDEEAADEGSGGLLAEWFAPKVDAQAMAAELRDELDGLRGDLVDDGMIADEDDVVFTVTAGSGGGPQGSRYDLQIKSDDAAALRDANDRILEALEDEDNWTENPKFTELPIINLTSNLSEARSVIQVQVDPAKAVAKGLSTIQVGLALREMIEGADLGDVELVDGDTTETLEVFARYPSDMVGEVDGLRALVINGPQGAVPLEAVATITEGPGPVQVTRIDGERAVVISGEITSQDTFGVLDQADKIIAEVVQDEDLDEDVTVGAGAESRQQREGFRDMLIALPISILIVYLIMVLTFGSLVHPFTILFSLPFAVSGALAALAITDRAISMSSLIGMMMLIGIVTTNAIVLVDLVQQYRAEGMDAKTALIEGGRHRLRPIVMTAIATIIALIPQAIGFTEGALIASELATTVIGGLLASTVLTLVIVPVIYSLLDRLTGGDAQDRPAPAEAPAPPPAEPAPTPPADPRAAEASPLL
jgi:HAE1 family hydrophobic/amphiphilic exporter-1